jgi:hypothetical protein
MTRKGRAHPVWKGKCDHDNHPRHQNEICAVVVYQVRTSREWCRRKNRWGNPAPTRERNPPRRRSQRLTALLQTMPCPLPPEIIDHIVDHLHEEPAALKACCVVSKSWVPRTRTHLFACIEFHAPKLHIELWKKTFPDSSNSPAHHTRHLLIRGLSIVTAADAKVGAWIRPFKNLVHLHLEFLSWEERVSLDPFHGLSPTLRSLRLTSSSPDLFDLICSFPLLEDLTLISPSYGSDVWSTPPTSPKLTGSLNLTNFEGISPVVRRLLDLPGGLHFAKVAVASIDADAGLTTDLVARCSDTLESLSIDVCSPCAFPLTSMSGGYLTTVPGPSCDIWGASA